MLVLTYFIFYTISEKEDTLGLGLDLGQDLDVQGPSLDVQGTNTTILDLGPLVPIDLKLFIGQICLVVVVLVPKTSRLLGHQLQKERKCHCYQMWKVL